MILPVGINYMNQGYFSTGDSLGFLLLCLFVCLFVLFGFVVVVVVCLFVCFLVFFRSMLKSPSRIISFDSNVTLSIVSVKASIQSTREAGFL